MTAAHTRCRVCRSPDRTIIDEALADGARCSTLADEFDLPTSTIGKHAVHHLSDEDHADRARAKTEAKIAARYRAPTPQEQAELVALMRRTDRKLNALRGRLGLEPVEIEGPAAFSARLMSTAQTIRDTL